MGSRLAGKTALVTGGGTGIGRAIAEALAAEGCHVAISSRRQEVLDQVVAACPGEATLLARAADVADRESVAALFRWAAEALGSIDILVNSAGVNVRDRSMAVASADDWEMVLRVNASGAFYCMQQVLPAMRERGDGLIVNISSIAGKRASTLGGVAYSASKFAMTALGTTVGLEEGRHGIRVTNIYPGEVNTPILDNRPVKVSDQHKAAILQPDDVAAAVLMVACLDPRAHVPELVIKPTRQEYA